PRSCYDPPFVSQAGTTADGNGPVPQHPALTARPAGRRGDRSGMTNDNLDLLKRFALPEEELDAAVSHAMGTLAPEQIDSAYEASVHDFAPNTVIKGRVIRQVAEDVMVDIGRKSEGVVPLYELDDMQCPPPGTEIEVL